MILVSSSSSANYARVAALAPLPREYQVRIDVHRPASARPPQDAVTGPFVVGLVGPKGAEAVPQLAAGGDQTAAAYARVKSHLRDRMSRYPMSATIVMPTAG